MCKHAFDTVLLAVSDWLYTQASTYPELLEQHLLDNYVSLVEMYVSSGVYVHDKDLFPKFNTLVHHLSDLYRAEIVGALRREDPCHAAYQIRCVAFDHRKIAIVITV